MREGSVLLHPLVAVLVGLLGLGQPFAAEPATPQRTPHHQWDPGGGETGPTTRSGPRFEGLSYLHPVRLHLSLGGHVDGSFGGVDGDSGELLLVVPLTQFRVSFRLISAVTPLGGGEYIGDDGLVRDILDQRHTEMRLTPTWRSHAGVALSLLAPGVGQFIQKKDQELGFLFMGLDLFMAAGALLSIFAAPGLDRRDRIGISASFAGIAVAVSITAAVHAFQTGRERKEVEVREAPLSRSQAGQPP